MLTLAITVFVLTDLPWVIVPIIFAMMSEPDMATQKRILSVTSALSSAAIAICLSYGIIRIRKYSKMLVQSEIFANEIFMLVHLLCFICLSLADMMKMGLRWNLYDTPINELTQE